MECPKGHVNAEDSIFCNNCGLQIVVPESSNLGDSEPTGSSNDVSEISVPLPLDASSSKSKWIIVVIAVVIVVLIVVAATTKGFGLFHANNLEDSAGSSTVTIKAQDSEREQFLTVARAFAPGYSDNDHYNLAVSMCPLVNVQAPDATSATATIRDLLIQSGASQRNADLYIAALLVFVCDTPFS